MVFHATGALQAMTLSVRHWFRMGERLFYPGVILLMILISGCGLTSPPPTPSGTPTATRERTPTPEPPTPTPSITPPPRFTVEGDVSLWLSWTPQELRSLEYVIEEFRSQYPGVSVHVVYYPPDQIRPAFESAVESGGPAGLLLGPAQWGPGLWEAGLIRDLSVRITGELHESILPLAWSQVAYQGAVLGLPLELQGVVLYRNRALVRSRPSSLEEMIRVAQELQADGVVKGAALDMGFMYSASHIEPCGGDLSFQADSPVLEPESGLCWLELLSRFSEVGPVSFDADTDQDDFLAGEAGWYWDTTEAARQLDQELGVGNLVIDPWPRDSESDVGMAGFVWSENIYFAASTSAQETEAAWVFASFLLDEQSQITLSEVHGAGHLPVLRELRLGTDLQQQAMDSLMGGVAYPLAPRHSRYMEPIEDAVRMVTEGRGDPEFALAVALEGVQGLFPTPTPEATASPTP